MTEDEQEALSLKYCAVPVAALASGLFAVFGRFSNEAGLPLIQIVELPDLRAALIEAQEHKPQARPARLRLEDLL